MSLVAYGDSSSESEVEEGGEVEASANDDKSDVRKLLGLLPPPKGSKPSGKHPVRISLPTVKSGGDSDDDDEESTQVKRVKIQGGASRLTALLPQPKSQPKQLGATRKPTIQTMVPYTLSKRRQDSIKAEKLKSVRAKSHGKPVAGTAEEGGSDSDEEPTSFFSHLEEGERLGHASSESSGRRSSAGIAVAPVMVSEGPSATASSATLSTVSGSVSESHEQILGRALWSDSGSHLDPAVSAAAQSSHSLASSQQSNRSGFSWEQFSSGMANSAPYTAQPYTYPYQNNSSEQSVTSDPSASGEVGASEEDGTGGEDGEGGAGGEGQREVMQSTGPGVIIEEEALRRLAGGSHRRRGREDALNNIVDILGDEVMEDVRVYRRHYGEDPSITKLYKADNSKLRTPTGQQKRKHQITWLAHEAKEKELELQKQWAVGSQARKDSRSKYGF